MHSLSNAHEELEWRGGSLGNLKVNSVDRVLKNGG